MKHFKLGASIYVPASRQDLITVASMGKFKARSIIFCTEDSVSEKDLPASLINLEDMLKVNQKNEDVLKFIRVRNLEVLSTILKMENVQSIDGFVLPKVTPQNFPLYWEEFKNYNKHHSFLIMPTLETKEVFDNKEMENLRNILLEDNIKEHILSLRIGGNDLLNLLGIRRSRYRTIYETPLGVTISNLVTIFKPYGFNLTSPVCEFLHDNEILNKELPMDLEHGLFGKTAIHPDQIKVIENAYRPTQSEYDMAEAMLKEDAKAVFGMHGAMCEVATHYNWAVEIMERAKIYGIYGVDYKK